MASNEETVEATAKAMQAKEECRQMIEDCQRKLMLLETLANTREEVIEEYFENMKREVLEKKRQLHQRVDAHFDQELENVAGRQRESKMGG